MIPVRTVGYTDRLGGLAKTGARKARSEGDPSLADAVRIGEWCELHGHPHSRLSICECLCGLVRYDE